MTEASTTIVNFTVTDIERVRGAGRLVALAKVELELDGVMLVLQGVRVVRQGDCVTTQAPRFRDPPYRRLDSGLDRAGGAQPGHRTRGAADFVPRM